MEIQPGLILRSAQTREPSSIACPNYQNDRIREICPSLIKLAFADCLTCRAICELLGLSRSSERCGTSSVGSAHSFTTFILPNPRSINQTKALLDKLSPRASKNQYSQSISQATIIGPHFSSEKAPPTAIHTRSSAYRPTP